MNHHPAGAGPGAAWAILLAAAALMAAAAVPAMDAGAVAAADSDAGVAEAPDLSSDRAAGDADAPPLPGHSPAILPGERLTFSVGWGPVKAGTAVMEIQGIRRFEGRLAYHVVSTAVSNAVLDRIYPVRDRIVSLMDVNDLTTLYFEKHLREGGYRSDQSVRFDHERGVAVYQDGGESELESAAFDVLAAFYRVRTMPLEPGEEFFLDSFDNRKRYSIRVRVTGRERVTVPAGAFDCIVVEPTLKSGALFKHEGRLHVWITDDERRMPVLMRSRLTLGAVSAELTEYHRPERISSAPGGPTPD